MSPAIPSRFNVFCDVRRALDPLVNALHAKLNERPLDLTAIKFALIAVLEFLNSPAGRTDANCRAVDGFFSHDDGWINASLPDAYYDVIAHMMHCMTQSPSLTSEDISIRHRSNFWREHEGHDI